MRSTERIVLAFSVVVQAAGAHATATRRPFAIPPTTLERAIEAFSIQAGVDVGLSGSDAAQAASRGVRGRFTPNQALDRILAGTRWRAVALPSGFRIVERREPIPTVVRPTHSTRLPPSSQPADGGMIVVTAGRGGLAGGLPPAGSAMGASLIDTSRFPAGRGLSDALADVPIVQSTALGAGREKLFIRGIADSSFLGPTQSTTGIYFGDVQLAAAGPDPNLKLYDVDRVEILEGPQGTLYGAGTIGGVIRIVPNAPGLDRSAASLTIGVTGTQGGALGHDMAGFVNLPVVRDVVGVRLVGYRDVSGGYVDDTLRRLRNVNRTISEGGRAAVRIVPREGWTLDLSGAGQEIASRDSQYALHDQPGLSRRSAMPQPFRTSLLLGRAVLARHWDSGLVLSLVGGVVRAHAQDRFDASFGRTLPLAFDTSNLNNQHTEEVRLSRAGQGGASWLLGALLLSDRDRIARALGPADAQRTLVGVTNRAQTQAVFGEATVAVAAAFQITAGLRLSHARIDSEALDARVANGFVRGREQTRLDPTIGTNWSLTPRLAWYTRVAKAYRTGGLSVAAGIGRVGDFASDGILVAETGLRWRRSGASGFVGTIGYSRARWRNIQADLIDVRGFPYTTNIGDNRINGVEATGDWKGGSGIHLVGGLFYVGDRGLTRDPTVRFRGTRLPDTPRLSGSAALTRSWRIGQSVIEAGLLGRYVGRSYLDSAALLNIRQGGFASLDATAGWRIGSAGLSLALENLTNTRGDRFALGNPFGVASGNQYTPLHPRSLRLAITLDRLP